MNLCTFDKYRKMDHIKATAFWFNKPLISLIRGSFWNYLNKNPAKFFESVKIRRK